MSDPDDLIPRRLPPSSAERLKTIASRTAGGNNAGATRWGRHVGSGLSTRPYQPPQAAVPTASASYRDPRSSFGYGFGDPSAQFKSFGDDADWFAYDSGSQGIALLQAGWYQFAVDGFINGGTAGEVVRVLGFFTTPLTVEGIDIIDGTGQAHPNCVTLPFYDDGTGTVIQIQVINQSGSSGLQENPTIHLVAFG